MIKLRKELILLVSITAIFIALEILIWPQTVTFKDDAYKYIALAKNLVSGKGLVMYGHPSFGYLIGFPAVIAFLNYFTKDLTTAAKLVNLFAGLGSILLAFFLWKRIIDWRAGALVSMFLVSNSIFLVYSNISQVEMFFSCLILASFASLFIKSDKKYLLLGSSLSALILTRYEGYIAALAILITSVWWKKLYKLGCLKEFLKNKYVLAGLCIFVATVAFQLIHNLRMFGSIIPIREYSAISTQVAVQEGLKGSLYEMFVSTITPLLLLMALAGVFLVFFDKVKIKKTAPILLFLTFFIALHLWFLYYDDRYFVPVLPFIYGFSAYCLLAFAQYLQKSLRKYSTILLAIIVTIIIAVSVIYATQTIDFHIRDRTTDGLIAKTEGAKMSALLPADAKIYIRDVPTYQLYFEQELYDGSDFEKWAEYEWGRFVKTAVPDPPETVRKKLLQFWIENDIHYIQTYTNAYGTTNVRNVQLLPTQILTWDKTSSEHSDIVFNRGTITYNYNNSPGAINLLPIILAMDEGTVIAAYYKLDY